MRRSAIQGDQSSEMKRNTPSGLRRRDFCPFGFFEVAMTFSPCVYEMLNERACPGIIRRPFFGFAGKTEASPMFSNSGGRCTCTELWHGAKEAIARESRSTRQPVFLVLLYLEKGDHAKTRSDFRQAGGCGPGARTSHHLVKAAWAQTFTTLYSFSNTGTGGRPSAGLVQATNGDLYGTAGGTAFKITPGGTPPTLTTICSSVAAAG